MNPKNSSPSRNSTEAPASGGIGALVTEQVCAITERRPQIGYGLLLVAAIGLLCLLISALSHLVGTGIGLWGNQQAIGWAWDITGFVFWIGIGHAGTLISAILFLFRQHWRTSLCRAAEAVTLFAVIAAAVYPVFHLGRVWFAYWLFPVPNQMQLWPNFKSPLTWDVFAISTYFLVSLMFWYLGLIPDLATLRDRATTRTRRWWLTRLSLGWRNSQRDWQYYERTYLTLAGLATPLVVSVHTIVSFDFAVSILPGWHSTIFPPYFVAGAVLSGSALVGAMLVVVRRVYGLERSITVRHLESLNKLILATATMVGAAYLVEFYLAWHSGDAFEKSVLFARAQGSMAAPFAVMVLCNVFVPQLHWIESVRRSTSWTVVIGMAVSLGMWLERYVIVVNGLDHGFLPSTFSEFRPSLTDVLTFVGSFGLFLTLFLLFLRFVPIMSMSELHAEHYARSAEPAARSHSTLGVTSAHAESPVRAASGLRETEHSRRHHARVWRWLLASFGDVAAMLAACTKVEGEHSHFVDAHASFPVPEFYPKLREDTSSIAWAAGISGAVGAVAALGLQYYAQAIAYPMLLGNKPIWSWQAAVPIAFEVAVLFAAIGCFVQFLRSCQLSIAANESTVDRLVASAHNSCLVSLCVDEPMLFETTRTLQLSGAERIVEIAP